MVVTFVLPVPFSTERSSLGRKIIDSVMEDDAKIHGSHDSDEVFMEGIHPIPGRWFFTYELCHAKTGLKTFLS